MTRQRLEAFSDGVIAIIITIMVLELRPPHEPGLAALRPLLPVFSSYVLSFVFLGIYWSNHHHLLHAVQRVDGRVLWANLHLLFWLSLVPFVTAWMGGGGFGPLPVAAYGVVMLCAGFAYFLLTRALLAAQGDGSLLSRALGSGGKEKISLVMYVTAVALAFAWPPAACLLYVAVAVMWLVPDRRIESRLSA